MHNILILLMLFFTLSYAETWEESTPSADKCDWVQLTSGEWLKGEIKGMYDKSLEFDSKKLKLLTIDWKDIQQLKSSETVSLNIEGDGTVTGRLHLNGDTVTLLREDGDVTLERDLIISLTRGGEKESNYWSGKFALGITLSGGNTDKEEYAAKFNVKRQTSDTRFKVDYIGNYTQTNDIVTENNQRLSGSADVFQTRRFFWRPLFAEYYKDRFQNILAKYTFGVGAGYDIIASSKTNWTISGGPAVQETNFENVEPGEDDKERTPAFLVTTNYDIELSDNIDFIAKYQAYFVNQKSGTYIHHALATLETELINNFDLDMTLIWDRTQDPKATTEGYIPERDDYKMIFSIAYTY